MDRIAPRRDTEAQAIVGAGAFNITGRIANDDHITRADPATVPGFETLLGQFSHGGAIRSFVAKNGEYKPIRVDAPYIQNKRPVSLADILIIHPFFVFCSPLFPMLV